jgi:hypothetical protein
MIRRTIASLSLMMLAATPALAADGPSDKPVIVVEVRTEAAARDDSDAATPQATKRPAALPLLFGSLTALQAFDAYSTIAGLRGGAREANPMMQTITRSPATFWTMKVMTTALPMAIAEHQWKRSKTAAIVTMVLANGVAAAVAAHNASVLGKLR